MIVDNNKVPALDIAGLSFAYPESVSFMEDLNLRVMPGERVGLVGPNGSGKTTLFMLVCGILQAAAGDIRLFGEPVADGQFLPDVGLVFQNPNDQLFCPSVKDDVAFGPQNMGLSPEAVTARVNEALEAVGHPELAGRITHHLSEGEKHMVAIASVLAMQPRLIIYDEPSAGLDIRSRRRLIRLLQASQETLMIAAHDLELILEVCDRVVMIDKGRIVADGRPHDIMGNPELMEEHGQEKPHSLIPHQVAHQHHIT